MAWTEIFEKNIKRGLQFRFTLKKNNLLDTKSNEFVFSQGKVKLGLEIMKLQFTFANNVLMLSM